MSKSKKRALVLTLALTGIACFTFLIVKLAQGYKIDFFNQTLKPTGLLVATSDPDGAQIFINGKFESATDTTLSLPPGEYLIEIKKDGFITWKKNLTLKKELIVKTDAILFPAYPSLKSLTFAQVQDPVLSPDGQKAAYIATNSAVSKSGIWVLDLANKPLGLPRDPKLIAANTVFVDFSEAEISWSANSKQILASFEKNEIQTNYLLEAAQLNPATKFADITNQLDQIKLEWEEEKALKLEAQLGKLPEELLEILSNSTKDISLSLNERKILYTATASATISKNPEIILPATSTQEEQRNIEPNQIYVYDIKEDKNFHISSTEDNLKTTWLSTSRHLFVVQEEKIFIAEYDGTNWANVYSGPFESTFAYPFPSGNQILVLTSLGEDSPLNLYAIPLK